MKKVAILGCENSHANSFLRFVIKENKFDDIRFVGVYSDDMEAANKLNAEFGVPVMSSYDELVGKVDGIIVTARHGDNHYKYAKPYLASGIPMFIDKPITVSETDAVSLAKEAKANGVRLTGGSSCVHSPLVGELAKKAQEGKVLGGYLRSPVQFTNAYGDLFFYAQHLVEVMTDIYGLYPNSVKAYRNGEVMTAVFRYTDYDVTAQFVNQNYNYSAFLSLESGMEGGAYDVDDYNFITELANFHALLVGGEQAKSYRDFIAPVFILNALDKAMKTGEEVAINRVEEI